MNLKEFISENNLRKKEVAKLLFPTIGHPEQAMRRVMRGEAKLKKEQEDVLLRMVGNYDSMEFRIIQTETSEDKITLQHGAYTACIDFKTGMSTITYKEKLISSSLIHSKFLTIPEYIGMVKLVMKENSAKDGITNLF
jgi:hypothetical protein